MNYPTAYPLCSSLMQQSPIGAGALTPLQGTNAELFKYWQQPIWTTVWIYLSGLAGILLLQAFARQTFPATQAVQAAPWWAWIGGVLIIVTTLAAPDVGTKAWLGHVYWSESDGFSDHKICSITWAGSALNSIRLRARVSLGGVLMIAGVWLVSKF